MRYIPYRTESIWSVINVWIWDLAHYQFRIIIAYETIIIVIINQYKRTKLHVKSFRLSEAERS